MEDGPSNLDRSSFYAETKISGDEEPGQSLVLFYID